VEIFRAFLQLTAIYNKKPLKDEFNGH